jgi:hypothetical protein
MRDRRPYYRLNLSRFIVAMSCGRAELSGRVLRVGVRLPDAPGRIGDYLAV